MILSEISFLSNSQHKLNMSLLSWFYHRLIQYDILFIQYHPMMINWHQHKLQNAFLTIHYSKLGRSLITTLPSFFLKRTSIFLILAFQLMHLSIIIKFQHHEIDKWLILPSPKLIYALWKMKIKNSND